MTIDEPLEALTHSLELLASIVAEKQKRETHFEERYERAEAALQERSCLSRNCWSRMMRDWDKLEGR